MENSETTNSSGMPNEAILCTCFFRFNFLVPAARAIAVFLSFVLRVFGRSGKTLHEEMLVGVQFVPVLKEEIAAFRTHICCASRLHRFRYFDDFSLVFTEPRGKRDPSSALPGHLVRGENSKRSSSIKMNIKYSLVALLACVLLAGTSFSQIEEKFDFYTRGDYRPNVP